MDADNDLNANYGPWALIAGASAGIGAAYAEELASRGFNLVLIARREKNLIEVSGKITKEHAVMVRIFSMDLASPDFLTEIDRACSGLDIGLVIYNATFPAIGEFLDQTVEDHMRLIDVNCRGPVRLTHYFGERMKKRGGGGIILMSSLSAFQGNPHLSHYAASKAYTLVLGEGLAREFKEFGVDLLVCCPGATLTESFLGSLPAPEKISGIPLMKPRDVARQALKALGRREVVIPGIMNRMASFFMRRILTRRAAVTIMKDSSEKLYLEKPAKGAKKAH